MNTIKIKTIELKPSEDGYIKIAIKYDSVNEGGYVKSSHAFESDNYDSKRLRGNMYDLTEELKKLFEIPIDLEQQIFSVRKINLGIHAKKEKSFQFVCMMGLNEHDGVIEMKSPTFYSNSKLENENISQNLQVLVEEVKFSAEQFIRNFGVQLELFVKKDIPNETIEQ